MTGMNTPLLSYDEEEDEEEVAFHKPNQSKSSETWKIPSSLKPQWKLHGPDRFANSWIAKDAGLGAGSCLFEHFISVLYNSSTHLGPSSIFRDATMPGDDSNTFD